MGEEYMTNQSKDRFNLGPYSASRRTPVTFLNIESMAKLINQEISYVSRDMQHATMADLNPSYIFLYTDQPTNPVHYKRYHNRHGIASLFLFSYYKPAEDIKRRKCVQLIIGFLNVTSILLGQVNGDRFDMFHNKKWVAVPILTVWYLGGRYITMDNLYVGSIYSFLSAVKPPIVPGRLDTIVNSDIPIVTLTYFTSSYYSKQRNVEQSKFPPFLNSSLGLDPSKPWAILDEEKTLKEFTSFVKWGGIRKSISATDASTPLTNSKIGLSLGRKTFLFPIFQKGFGQLSSSGLILRWYKLSELYCPLELVYQMNDKNYKRYLLNAISGAREQVTFHESDPVSMKSVKEIYALCGMCLIFGIVSIIVECAHSVGPENPDYSDFPQNAVSEWVWMALKGSS
ncbi:hypothetical protein Fcan01_19227 [Folsomia candida]|uniref:Uncharacterized protein n=1 Tax=Folsomia candida TaxID=158441 RepID=A0A226DMJ2_FOLCA|nr:hypothetical protein Fcan01_19227 [Folsomia candida]